jgi:SagB-type dehydrogenase family enzyme
MTRAEAAEVVRAYHIRTKHRLDRYAAGPGSLDWDAQPDPFRVWAGAQKTVLPRAAERLATPWDELNAERPAAPLNLANLGNLLQLCAAITAWKEYAGSRWALRANPSSGNLHPTEVWVIAQDVEGLEDGLYHYQSRDHSLARRASRPETRAAAGSRESATTPALWLGFSSIHWREAWKYGERAFRYCQLDMGHMLAAVAAAAALLGWKPRLLPLDSDAVAASLGLDRPADFTGVEGEDPEAILALHPAEVGMPPQAWSEWHGKPNRLDPKPMYQWPVIEEVAQASRGGLPKAIGGIAVPPSLVWERGDGGDSPPLPATRVILKRRSAQAFDGQSVMSSAVFQRLLSSLLPGNSPAWNLWPLPPRVHPVLMVHRVDGLPSGVYVLPRSQAGAAGLRQAMRADLAWEPVAEFPDLPLYNLVSARCANAARTVSCHQDIAANCAVAFMLLAEFAAPLRENPAAYRHLHWEAGMLGHQLYLEAEAHGWRGTGIGCFFDDAVHDILGLTDDRYQVVYHFSVGVPVDDPRLLTRPAYE